MEYSEFAESITVMQSMFGKTLAKEAVAHYWARYKDLPDGKFKAAAAKLVDSFVPTSQVPFPLFAHINSAMGDTGRDVCVRMVGLVKRAIARSDSYHSVSFSDLAMHAVISRFGGWIAICGWTDHDWQIQEGRFVEAYQTALAAGEKGPPYFPGSHEIHNAMRGYGEHIPPVDVYDRQMFVSNGEVRVIEIPQAQIAGKVDRPEVEARGTGPSTLKEILDKGRL